MSSGLFSWVDGALLGTIRRCGTSTVSLESVRVIFERCAAEFKVELPLLKARWKSVVFCLVMQYVHVILTQLVYRLHIPSAKPLRDTGFDFTVELGPRYFWVSEALFGVLFASFLLWLLSPFYLERKSFYTVVVLRRLLVHLVCCQTLRVFSFFSTILPGPAHHCREGQPTATRAWVHHWYDHFVVDLRRQATNSCGDLIFSSHTTFIVSFVVTYTYYGKSYTIKCVAWALAAVLSILIICSRKHYTVDVVVAWYVVPLVFLALERRFTTKERNDFESLTSVELSSILVAADVDTSGVVVGAAEGVLVAVGDHGQAGSPSAPYSYTAVVSPKHLRKGSHSRRPTNEGLLNFPGRKPGPGNGDGGGMPRIQSKSKLGPVQ